MQMMIRRNMSRWFSAAVLAAAFLVLAEVAAAHTPVVEVLACQPSSQGARIRIDLNGMAAKDVRLIVTTLEDQLIQAVSIDGAGLAVLPALAPAKYLVTATAPENLGGSVCLEIATRKGKQTSSFSLTLKTLPPNSLTLEQILASSENNAPSEIIQEFKGVLVEPTGIGVSGAVVQIFPKGARVRDDAHSVRVITGATGQFSADLSDGIYIALFMSPGFQTKVVIFGISRAGHASDLRVWLQLGRSS
jgi:hypothetical protein